MAWEFLKVAVPVFPWVPLPFVPFLLVGCCVLAECRREKEEEEEGAGCVWAVGDRGEGSCDPG